MKKILLSGFVILTAGLFLFPVIATVFRSVLPDYSISIAGYKELFFDCFIFYPMFWNSIFYSIVITLLQLVIIIPCAFGFLHADFKGKGILYLLYIMLMMMPLQVTVLPNYIGLRDMNLIDTRAAIILPMIYSPFGVIVMHQYMRSIEDSVIEAARLETNSLIRILLTAVVPQLKVCIFAVVLFIFAECWNMVEQPLLFLKDNKLKTLTIMISQSDKYSPATLASASVIIMIPIILLYMFFNENLEKGLTLKELS